VLDETEIREFLRVGYPRVVAAVALVSGSRPAAEDAVQEALLRAWERSERGDEIDSLPRWVTTVALNLTRSGIRRAIAERRARRRLVAASTGGVPGPSGDRLDVDRALAGLPRRQREVAVLRYLLDMDTREAAEAMSVNEGTVKSQLAHARRALAAALRIEEFEVTNDVQG
jgi:RNA polymerase sigma-70 factor (ECF subfamily)